MSFVKLVPSLYRMRDALNNSPNTLSEMSEFSLVKVDFLIAISNHEV